MVNINEQKSNYDRLSKWYDYLAGCSELRYIALGIKKLDPAVGDRVLEIGCGTGYGLVSIARLVGIEGRVDGVDLSQGMIKVSKTRLQRAGFLPRVHLKRANASQLPYGNALFDAVFMSFTLELFGASTMRRVLCECHRVLRDDGRLCVVALSKSGCSVAKRIYEYLHNRFPQYIDCRPIRLRQQLEAGLFSVVEDDEYSLFGLPVSITLAKKSTANE